MRTKKIKGSRVVVLVVLAALLCAVADLALYVYEERQYDYDMMDVLSGAMIGRTVVVDAGHGGFDPGAIGLSGTLEKDVNLAVSRRLADYLRQSGATVLETRTEDQALAGTKKEDMAQRATLANENDADVLISIQANFLPQHQYSGAQTFYASDNVEGKALSESIQQSIIEQLGNTDRVPMSLDDVYLMNALEIPGVIVEVGFLSNAAEEQALNDADYQSEMAYAIYAGIVRYYNSLEREARSSVVEEEEASLLRQ